MKIVVIIGHWNSGSTLLTELLSRHPAARPGRARHLPNREERHTRRLLRQLARRRGSCRRHEWCYYNRPQLDEAELAWFRARLLRRLRPGNGGFALIKNPWLLYGHDLLTHALAGHDVRYVYITRRGANQVTSWNAWFSEARDLAEARVNLMARARLWVDGVETYRHDWAERDDCLAVRYEDLCREPLAALDRLAEFAALRPSVWRPALPREFTISDAKWQALPDCFREEILGITAIAQSWLDEHVAPIDAVSHAGEWPRKDHPAVNRPRVSPPLVPQPSR